MTAVDESGDVPAPTLADEDLRGARFIGCDLSGAEWSFAQTLRHLVMATDTWLGRAILESEHPYHPLGQPDVSYETDGHDLRIFTTVTPSYAEVLEVREGRVAMVRDFLATLTQEDLAAPRENPWAPEQPETTLSCLHTILEEEWEHHRYAVRDLDTIESEQEGRSGSA